MSAPAGENEPLAYESLFQRFAAAAIDNAVAAAVFFQLIANIPVSFYEDSPEAAGLVVIGLLSLWFNYFAYCEWRWGRTLGKYVMGMKVVNVDGSEIGFGAAGIRNLLRLVDWLVIGWVMIASSERHQRLGDKAAGTVVVRTRGARADQSGERQARPSRPASSNPPETRDRSGERAPGTRVDSAASSPTEPHPSRADTLPAVTWGLRQTVLGGFGGLVLGVVFAPLLVLPFDPDLSSLPALLAAQSLLALALLGTAAGIASGWDVARLREAFGRLGFRRFGLVAIAWIVVTMVAYYVVAGLFATFILEPEQEDISRDLGCGGSVLTVIAAYLAIAVIAPIAEETFFRGFVFGGLRTRLSIWPAAIISGLVFGLVHAPTGITAVVPLALLGALLAWLYERTGSIGPPIIAHAANNALALAVTGC